MPLIRKGVAFRDLEQGTEFETELDEREHSSDEEQEEVDEYDNFASDILKKQSEDEDEYTINRTPFADFLPTMAAVTPDRGVMKEVIKHGVGSEEATEKSVFVLHYAAFLDGVPETFDSTVKRRKPFRFVTGEYNVIPGLDLAIMTMKKDEVARVIISPEYAYREMGSPPRIPPNSHILYKIHIINIYHSKDAIEFEDMTPEEQRTAPFDKIVKIYHCENKMANEQFRGKCYSQAIARYRKVVKILETVSVSSEEDDEQRQGYLAKLYLNLAQCYIFVRNLQKAIIYADLVLKHEPENPKALFRMANALKLEGKFDKAESYLRKLQKNSNYRKEVDKEMDDLQKRRKHEFEIERSFARRAFRISGSDDPLAKLLEATGMKELAELLNAQMDEFEKSDDKELPLSPGYTEDQCELVKILARQRNLEFVSKIVSGEKINKVAKRQQY